MRAKQVRVLTTGVVAALLDGAWRPDAMAERLALALGRRWRWRHALVKRLFDQFSSPPNQVALMRAVAADPGFQKAVCDGTRPRIVCWSCSPTAMQPTFPEWGLPRLGTSQELADFLGISTSQLDWLADCENRQGQTRETRRTHYRRYWLRKPTGGWRLVEEPLFLLKEVQRAVLHGLLDLIPVHPAACAFTASRSIVDFATPHVGRQVVVHLDIRNFFPSIRASRIHAALTCLGYPAEVARSVTGLCTSAVPPKVCRQHEGGKIYSSPHLPQGAPTSPALANITAFRLDRRLAAVAQSAGGAYTRYADDLALSGDGSFARAVGRFLPLVWRIVGEEGFELNHRKTRVMRQSVRQRLCGLVVNSRINIDRRTYDSLKAILTNCVRHGLESQNTTGHPDFLAHLQGRVAFVEQINPERGARLRSTLRELVRDTHVWPMNALN